MNILLLPATTLVASDVAASLRFNRHVRSIVGLTRDMIDENASRVPLNDMNVVKHMPAFCDKQAAIEMVVKTVRTYGITHVIPTNDAASQFVSHLSLGAAVRIMTPPPHVSKYAFDKLATYNEFPELSPRQPAYFTENACYVKPRCGHSSIGCRVVADALDFSTCVDDDRLVVVERLRGYEYTVDCFGHVIVCVRRRVVTMAGMSVLATRENREVQSIIARRFRAVCQTFLGFDQPWFFQVMGPSPEETRLLEIQPRLGGGSTMSSMLSGVSTLNMWLHGHTAASLQRPMTSLQTASCRQIMIVRATHDSTNTVGMVVVDLDDTLIIGGHTNTELLGALIALKQRQTNRCHIVLCTRHRGDLLATLVSALIPVQLFDSVVHVKSMLMTKWTALHTNDKTRSRLVSLRGVILLIDDSYAERESWPGRSMDVFTGTALVAAMARPCYRPNTQPSVMANHESTAVVEQKNQNDFEICGQPSVLDVLQLDRLRVFVSKQRQMAIDRLRTTTTQQKRILDVGPSEHTPPPPLGSTITYDTVDIVPSSSCTYVGDVTRYLPVQSHSFDLMLVTEVLEHTTNPSGACSVCYDALKRGSGLLLVTTPFAFRLHRPAPDSYRFSPTAIVDMFKERFDVLKVSVLTNPLSELQPVDVAVLFRSKGDRQQQQLLPWAMLKSSHDLVNSSLRHHQYTNGGSYVRHLETSWASRMKLDSEEYACLCVCNGTIGLDVLARLHGDRTWITHDNTFFSDVENSFQDALVVPAMSLESGVVGPDDDALIDTLREQRDRGNRVGIIITSTFGAMSRERQRALKATCLRTHNECVVIFDHAVSITPSTCEVGDGCMFSMHETKPLGRGEGAILVVKKKDEQRARGLIAFGDGRGSAPVRHSTNAKMSDLAAFAILEWQECYDKYVATSIRQRSLALHKLFQPWLLYKCSKGVVPAVLALRWPSAKRLPHSEVLPVKRYYHPVDEKCRGANHRYSNSFCLPILPFVNILAYKLIAKQFESV